MELSMSALMEVRAWLREKQVQHKKVFASKADIITALIIEVEDLIDQEGERMAEDLQGPGTVDPELPYHPF